MRMRKNKFVPINSKLNSLKKTKVQFSNRLSGCLGEHQSQEFFERVNITRQSGICSKNKNNSFGDNRSNSFRQTLQLHVPFVADFSDMKQFCVCYPVHFFRKKLQSYDIEDNRLASIRVYFPASRMKNGNDFKMSLDLRKRCHLYPFPYEFVGYSSLLTLSLEDLSLAVFRAKSSSEKFKIASSLAIPKVLISATSLHSQNGTPVFIGTERIYSRILKLIACSHSDAFKLNNLSATTSDSNLHLKKCLLKWIGLEDFLPSSSRIIFVRRVSCDSGCSLGASILNSPGPKIRRSRLKECDRLSIRMKPTQLELLEEGPDDTKDTLFTEEATTDTLNLAGNDLQDNKRPRGRPKKVFGSVGTDKTSTTKKSESGNVMARNMKCESLQLKPESTSNSMTDSTSEEKYSAQLSSCTTPDTQKSCSPVILSDTVTTTVSSTSSLQLSSTAAINSELVKNKRGRPRKYPLSLNAERTVFKGHMDAQLNMEDSEGGSIKIRKRSNTDTLMETSKKMFRSSDSSVSSNEGMMSKFGASGSDSPSVLHAASDRTLCVVHSIWRPLKHPLSAPDPIVPFIKQLSNTGLHTDRKLKSSLSATHAYTEPSSRDTHTRDDFPELTCHKFNVDVMSENLSRPLSTHVTNRTCTKFMSNNHLSLRGTSPSKSAIKDPYYYSSSGTHPPTQPPPPPPPLHHHHHHNQYVLPNSAYNPLMLAPSMPSTANNNGIMPSFINNLFQSNNSPLINTMASLFSPMYSNNPMKIQTASISPSFFSDNTSCHPLFSNSHHYSTNDILDVSSPGSNHSQRSIQHQQIFLANKYDSVYPNISFNNDYQWKY